MWNVWKLLNMLKKIGNHKDANAKGADVKYANNQQHFYTFNKSLQWQKNIVVV